MFELLLLALLGDKNQNFEKVADLEVKSHYELNLDLEKLPRKKADKFEPVLLNDPNVAVLAQDLGSGKILFSHHSDHPQGMASLTKLMTFLIIFENHDLDEVVTVSPRATKSIGAKAGLYAYERITVKTLLEALLIPSANDAAVALAIFDAGSEDEFVKKMNQKAQALGLKSAKFFNASGLDEYIPEIVCDGNSILARGQAPLLEENNSPSPQSSPRGRGGHLKCEKKPAKTFGNRISAEDIMLLARINLKNDFFRKTVQKRIFRGTSVDGEFLHEKKSTNKLFDTHVNTKGIKTGYTPWAGQCFIDLVEGPDGQEVVTVVLGSSDRFLESERLIDWIWKSFVWK